MRAALVISCLALTSACVPLPYATPPIRMTVGGGAPINQDASDRVVQVRAAVHPQQLLSEPLSRAYDLGLGYVFEAFPGSDSVTHGAYAEGAYRLWSTPLGADHRLRLFAGLDAELLFTDVGARTQVGAGGTLSVHLELAGTSGEPFVLTEDVSDTQGSPRELQYGLQDSDGEDDPTGAPTVVGIAYGEWSIGAFASGGVRNLANQTYWVALGGVTFRLPASAGVLLLWLV